MLVIDGKKISVNEQGFLINPHDWNEAVAAEIAKQENVELTSERWELIHFARKFYLEYQYIPPLRVFIKTMQPELGKDKASSLYLYRQFPENPLRTICKIAGLPKPKHCL